MKIKKKPAAKKSFLTSDPGKVRVLALQLGALIASIIAGYLIWLHAIVNKEKQQLDQLSQQNAQYQQQIIQSYITSLLEKVASHSHSKALPTDLLSADALGNYRNTLIQNIEGLESVKFFALNQAKVDETDIPINFIVIDMINRSERDAVVHPEVIKDKKSQAWFIAIVAPIYQQPGQTIDQSETPEQQAIDKRDATQAFTDKKPTEEIIGTMYFTVSIDALKTLLSSLDQTLGQTQLVQRVGDEIVVPFITVGNGGNYPTQQLAIADSNWQLSYTPSVALYTQAKQPRIPIMLAIAGITLLLVTFCWFAAQQINRWLKTTTKSTSKTSSTKLARTSKKQIVAIASNDNLPKLSKESQPLAKSHVDKQKIAVADQQSQYKIPDSIFRAYDIRGIADKQLTSSLATAIGQAFASEVLRKGDKAIFIGRDGRIHSPKMAEAFTRGVLSTGCDVIDLGVVPTPLMNFATSTAEETSSGAMVTASHNPKEYNGFKFVARGRTLVDEDMQTIKKSVASNHFNVGEGVKRSQDISRQYIEKIIADIALVDSPHIVIDAANGATSIIAPMLFEELGCTVTRLFCEIDGNFPNHEPDPSVVENLQHLIDKVKEEQADMGLAFDGDGDRLVVVTPNGNVIWPDQLTMLFAEDIASRNPGCDIIYDVKSTCQLSQIITRCGGRPVMWKTGHAHMKTKMRETGALLAGEFSGHIFFKERWFGFDDGMYAAARLLEIVALRGRDVDDIFKEFQPLITTPEIKIPVGEEEKFTIIESLLEKASFANGKQSNIDGIRVDFQRSWGLIRASNTTAALTLRFEAETEEDMEKIKRLFRCELNRVNAKLSKHF